MEMRNIPSGVIALRLFGRLKVMVAMPWDISTFTPGFMVVLLRAVGIDKAQLARIISTKHRLHKV